MKHQSERRKLCIEMEALKERLFRAGLYETAQKMNEACQVIGYECARQFTKETTAQKRKAAKHAHHIFDIDHMSMDDD